MTKIAFLDTETTGLSPRYNEIMEVAYITRELKDPDKGDVCGFVPDQETHFSLYFDPQRADMKALEVNRYYARQRELEAIRLDQWHAVEKMVRDLRGVVIVGNNPQFDLRFIERFLINHGVSNPTPWNYHPVDLKALVMGHAPGSPQPPWRTGDVAEVVGVPIPNGYHSALVDARWNRDVYDAFYGG